MTKLVLSNTSGETFGVGHAKLETDNGNGQITGRWEINQVPRTQENPFTFAALMNGTDVFKVIPINEYWPEKGTELEVSW